MVKQNNEVDNVCCPELEVIACADSDDHKHLICGDSKAILSNNTIIDMCIKDHHKCLLQGNDILDS